MSSGEFYCRETTSVAERENRFTIWFPAAGAPPRVGHRGRQRPESSEYAAVDDLSATARFGGETRLAILASVAAAA
jgi:hypothetical protein